MNLSWNELACHGLGKKLPEKELVALVMIHLKPMRKKWMKDHGTGEIEKYIMENGIHGSRKLFESPYISKEMWCKAALRREFKVLWYFKAPEKRREKCYNVVLSSNTGYSASTWGERIMGMPDELLKNDVHGLYETLDDGWVEQRQWDDKWSRGKDKEGSFVWSDSGFPKTYAILRAKWYKDIHEGRYFLFFKMNEKLKIRIEKRVGNIDCRRFVPEIAGGDMHGCDIMGFSSEAQCASDLLTIDGPGLNHSPDKEVMHIDDMFY